MISATLIIINLTMCVWAYFSGVSKIRKEIDLCERECEYFFSSTNEIMIDYSNKLSDLQKQVNELKEARYKTGKPLGRPQGNKNKPKD